MGSAEYIVRFKGDYSALAKDLKSIGAATKKIEDDEVIVKLAYDGNIKEFNKVFDQIAKKHPELGIQFQYNVNEKILKQETDRLEKLTELEIDIKDNKVQNKLENLAGDVEHALEEGLGKDEITKRLKNVFGYYNTAIKAGAKNINFKDIKDRLDDAFSIEADEIQDILGEVIDLNINKPIQLFKIDKSINEDIAMTQERVDDLKDSLKSLEEKGASKSGSPSEIKQLQDDIRILRSDIEDMQTQLQNLSGEAFDEMTESIRSTNEQLKIAEERLKIVQDFLKNNGSSEMLNFTGALNKLQRMLSEFYKENNGNHISVFWDELINKAQNGDEEVLKLLSDLRLLKDANLPGKVNAGMVKSGGLIGDDYTVLTTKIRSDKFSGDRLKNAEELKKRLDAISDSGVNAAKTLAIVSDEASNLFVEIQETAPGKMLGQIYGQTEEDWVNTDFFEATDAEILKLIVDLETLRKAGIGVELNAGNLLYEKGNGFTIIDMDLDPLKDYEETISEAQNVLFDSIRQFYELQTDESGNITAEAQTAINALDIFSQKFGDIAEKKKAVIDQLSTAGANNQQITINDAAKEATQKAADALQEAQDSNSPAELTKPLGKDFGFGYAEGIRDAMPEVIKACKEIVLAAYDAVKETSDQSATETSGNNNFSENFINNLKDSLTDSVPIIKGKIDEIVESLSLSLSTRMNLRKFGQTLIQEIADGIESDCVQANFTESIQSLINRVFKNVILDAAIEVKPYMRKGGEIEEIDLPGNNTIGDPLDNMVDDTQKIVQNLHLITDEFGNIKTFYRGLRNSMGQGLVSDRFNGATFWTDSFDLAKEYSNWTKVESANLSMIKPLEIQGNGANWNNIEYLGTGTDEASKKIIEAKNKMLEDLGDMQTYAEQEGYHFKEITTEHGMKEFRRYMSEKWFDGEGFPDEVKQEIQHIKDKVEEGWAEYKAISDDDTNVYGRHTTKEFVALAQKSGQYDGVIFKDIIDSASGVVRDATNVVVQFNEDKIKFIETLKASDNLNERDIDAIAQNYSQVAGRIEQINQQGRTKIGGYDSEEEKAELQKELELYEQILPILKEYKEKLIEIRNAKVDRDNIVVPQEKVDSLKNKILSSLKQLYSKRDTLTLDDVANEFKFDTFTKDEIGRPLLEKLTDETTTTEDLLALTDQLYEQEFKRYQINGEILKQKNQQVSDLSKDIATQYQASNENNLSSEATSLPSQIDEITQVEQREAEQARETAEAEIRLGEARISDIDKLKELEEELDIISKKREEIYSEYLPLYERASTVQSSSMSKDEVQRYFQLDEELSRLANKESELKKQIQELRFDKVTSSVREAVGVTEIWYRRIHDVSEILQTTGAFFADTLKLASTYFSNGDRLVAGRIDKSDFLTVDAKGKRWNDLYEISEDLEKQLLQKGGNPDKYLDPSNNVYKGNTKYISQLAKALGYLGVEIQNVIDTGANNQFGDFIGNILQVFDKSLVSNIYDVTDAFLGLSDSIGNVEKVSQVRIRLDEMIRNQGNGDFTEEEKKVYQQLFGNSNIFEGDYDKKSLFAQVVEIRDRLNDELSESLKTESQELIQSLKVGDITPNDFLKQYKDMIAKYQTILYQASNETPVSTESTEAETKALLSKKEVVQQLRTELNLTKKAAEELFDQQGYTKTNNKYQIEQAAVEELIASLKEKQETEESTKPTQTSATTAMQSEVSAVNDAIEAEKKKFDELKNKISTTIPNAIKKKNEAFEKEGSLVAKIVDDEIDYFEVLKDSVDGVTDSIGKQQNIVKDSKPKKGKSTSKSSDSQSNEPDKEELLRQHNNELWKNYFQSIGQKSQTQQEMSKYYAELQEQSAKTYSNAEAQANKLLKKVEKLQNSGKYTQDFTDELENASNKLKTFLQQLKDGNIDFEKVDDEINVLAENVEETLAKKAFGNVKQAAEKSLTNVGLKIDQIIAKNSAMGKEFESRFKALRSELDGAKSVEDVQRIVAAVNKLESELISAGQTGKSFIDQIKQRLRDINSKYIAQYFSFQDIIRYARQAVTNVIELNDAFIELSKVSDTSLKTLENDFQSYANIAKTIGGTITDTINATADWARMGYSVPDSKELARVAMLYRNVGDGIDITAANESLISTLQGYQMQADEAEHIVDVFNEVYS